MNPDNTVEYNSLSWVKTQLDDVLSDAQSSLNEYIENQTAGELENCIEHLQLIYGTLQMVEVYGASMLAEEMQQTTTALLEGNIDRAEDVYDVLMRAMLQLPDYLEGIQAGKKDAPITLMPLINDLRAARKEGLLTESVLFSPDVETATLSSDAYDSTAIESGKLKDEVKRLRTHYQLGLLDFIRNNKERVGLQRIKAVLQALEKVSSDDEVRQMWMVVGALVEGLLKQGIDTNLSIKMLLGAVDRQLKLILDNDEDIFSEKYSKEIVKNILYYVGLCKVDSQSISAVKQAYHLDELIPQESDDNAAIGGLNADLFDTVSRGITEDLAHVKEILELFMHSNEKDVEQLSPVVEQLTKIADTYGMLGMGATRQLIMDQRNVLDAIVKGDAEITDQSILDVASGLLNAESELKEFIDSRSGFVDMSRSDDGEDKIVPAAEYREVVHTVVAEGLKNFGEAKEAILSYVSGIGDKGQLDIVLKRLEEVRGVSMMLPLGRVESLIERLQTYIRIALVNNNHKPDDSEQDTVADVVTSIEYFFEALSEGRPGVEQGLNAGDAAAVKLEAVCDIYGHGDSDSASVDNKQERSEDIAFDKDDELKKGEASETVTPVSLVKEKSITEYTILADDADEEIVEIFIEEAVEVLGELHEYLPQWKANNDDEESLAVIRRSFHTLKGSGRLLGAEMIGEFSWKFENMLNRVIDNKITVSDDLFNVLNEALAVLPQLIEQLKGNREPIENIGHLMLSADAIADGHDIPPESPEVQQQDGVDETDGVVDALAIDSVGGVESDIVLAEVSLDETDFEVGEPEETLPEVPVEIALTDVDEIDLEMDEDAIVIEDVSSSNDENDAGGDFNSESEIILDSTENKFAVQGLDALEPDIEDSIVLAEDPTEEESAEDKQESEDVITVSDVDVDADDEDVFEYDVVIDEGGAEKSGSQLDIDPMLLQIYHDESQGYVASIRQLIEESESNVQPLKAGKDLIRAFHTLYGSARTAEVDSIADLSGAAEKYVKVRQESGEEDIPADVVEVFKDVERVISEMLSKVSDGYVPAGNKALQDKINKIVQQEIQQQLQQSWQSSSTVTELDDSGQDNDDLSIDLSELSPDVQDEKKSEPADTGEDEGEQPSDEKVLEQAVRMSYGDIDDELIDIFLEEADELLENCEDTLSEIKATPNSIEYVQQLQRNMHTLKGGARMADLSPVGDLTHKLESLIVLVSENKVKADKTLFDLLQESLDALVNMMTSVKKREPLTEQNELNSRIEMLMRGEVREQRSVERFDVELTDLESGDEEDLEEIDISQLLPEKDEASNNAGGVVDGPASHNQENKNDGGARGDRPHWGERASDVNYKDSQEQVRVRSDLLNSLVDYAGEVNIYHARMGKQITDFGFNLSELSQTVVRLKEQLRNLEIETEIQIRSGYETESDNYDDDFDPLEMDQYSTLQQLTRSLSETAADVDSINEILADITRDSETLLVQESRISTDLQEGLMRTRMVRFGGLSSRLRRIVRQVARELGKEVEVDIEGEGSEVDRTVLDRIIAPIEHILRNAVAHGIEKPEDRKAQGKNDAGKITIRVDRQGTDVVINIRDDGRGIDTEKVREKAIQQGLVAADAKLSDHDALQFILQSGFSTADEVTQVAGRGVGMDVVDSEIKQLGGVLDIDTAQGKGSDFNIRLPLTLAINQALLVSAGDDVFAVPLASIEGVVRMTGYELQRFYDSDNSLYEFNGVEFELKHLGGLLTGVQPSYSKQLQLFPVLLVRVGDQHFALHVDDMLGRREIVVKPVGLQIGAIRGIAGATILADGRVVLILEMSALVAAESLFKPHEPIEAVVKPVKDDKKTIMVVDDSITIRKITERMLKRYGIEVVLAKDGVDATSQLQDNIPDLMLLDIEMPRMDGFEVASFVRNDDRLKDIPIIMITSRTGSKHKEKAMEIGVNKYLGKPFQEEDLVNNINDILHTAF